LPASPPRSKRRDLKRNYLLFFVESVGYPLGFSLISSSTIIPLLLTTLGASNVVVGMAPALGNLGLFLPGVFSAPYMERTPIKKRIMVSFALVERAFILLIAVMVLIWGSARPSWAILGFLIAWTLSNVAAGVNLPAYFAMLAKCIPPDARGGLFGWGGALSGIVGVAAAEYAGVVLTSLAFPGNFALLFTAAAVVLTASVIPLLWTREPPDQIAGEHRSVRQYLSDAIRSAGGDREYAWAVASIAALSFALAAASFYSTYAVRELGATTRDVARFTAITLGASVVGMPLLGRIADRRGHKLSLEITATCFAIAAVLALSAGSVESVYAVTLLSGIGMSGVSVSQNLLLSEFAPTHADVPMYIVFSWLVLAPFRTGAPIVAGLISDLASFQAMFWITLVAAATSLAVLLIAVREPRHR
jgi:MFS family permease